MMAIFQTVKQYVKPQVRYKMTVVLFRKINKTDAMHTFV